MRILRSLGFFIFTMLIYLGVPLVGWGLGDLQGFFSMEQRLCYALLVLALGVAEYIRRPEAWLQHLRRVITGGGLLLVSFPHSQCLARRVGRVMRRTARVVTGRGRGRTCSENAVPFCLHRRAADFDELLTRNGFRVTFRAFCGVRLLPWPLDESRRLTACIGRLEGARWLSGRRSFGAVYMAAAKVSAAGEAL